MIDVVYSNILIYDVYSGIIYVVYLDVLHVVYSGIMDVDKPRDVWHVDFQDEENNEIIELEYTKRVSSRRPFWYANNIAGKDKWLSGPRSK